jgi:hypothetical protein
MPPSEAKGEFLDKDSSHVLMISNGSLKPHIDRLNKINDVAHLSRSWPERDKSTEIYGKSDLNTKYKVIACTTLRLVPK